jgi:HK97 gp10 family phage protein
MPTVRGRTELKQFLAQLPGEIERKLLRGAGRAAANVIADEAKERSISSEVSSAIKVKVSAKPGQVIAKVQVKGKGAYIAPWLEYGTSPHFISVDDSQRQGMSIGRINRNVLVINGQPVGRTVHHPGATPHPFLRPALDMKADAALAAAQGYINSRVGPGGITGSEDAGDAE